MFEELEVALEDEPCDHTRRRTVAWLQSRSFDAAKVAAWLDETGGFCELGRLIAQAQAEVRRAAAVALEQENVARN